MLCRSTWPILSWPKLFDVSRTYPWQCGWLLLAYQKREASRHMWLPGSVCKTCVDSDVFCVRPYFLLEPATFRGQRDLPQKTPWAMSVDPRRDCKHVSTTLLSSVGSELLTSHQRYGHHMGPTTLMLGITCPRQFHGMEMDGRRRSNSCVVDYLHCDQKRVNLIVKLLRQRSVDLHRHINLLSSTPSKISFQIRKNRKTFF